MNITNKRKCELRKELREANCGRATDAQGAMTQLLEHAKARGKKCTVVDCDLKQFFDTVDHQLMMLRLRESIVDEALLGLLTKFLKARAITPEGKLLGSPQGMSQGGHLSPLLANILLDDLDKEIKRRGHDHVRYADDFIILCNSQRAGNGYSEVSVTICPRNFVSLQTRPKAK